MEASIVASKLLVVILHTIVEYTKLVFLVRITIHACVVALVLLHRQVSIFSAWNVLSSHFVIMATELIVAFLVEVEPLRIKEVATWKNIETIGVIFSWSVLDFLPSVLLDSRRWLLHLTILGLPIHWSIWLKLTKFGWRLRWLCLVLKLTISKAISVRRNE